MMNVTEHLLACLGEESGEIVQETGKALRFGLFDFKPGQPDDNLRRIEREMAEALTVFELLGFQIHEEDKTAKLEKLAKYMDYSRNLGMLEPEGTSSCPRCGTGHSVFTACPPGPTSP